MPDSAGQARHSARESQNPYRNYAITRDPHTAIDSATKAQNDEWGMNSNKAYKEL